MLRFGVIGGVNHPNIGTFAEYIVVERDEVIPPPPHVTDVQIAAWPLAGVTAWRFASFHPPRFCYEILIGQL